MARCAYAVQLGLLHCRAVDNHQNCPRTRVIILSYFRRGQTSGQIFQISTKNRRFRPEREFEDLLYECSILNFSRLFLTIEVETPGQVTMLFNILISVLYYRYVVSIKSNIVNSMTTFCEW